MPAANIQINAVTGSYQTVALNVPVQLSNDDVGGESTYSWSIVDQPEGAAVSLTNTTIEAPVFTPTKEGSYFLRLVVNAGGGVLERIGFAVVSVLTLRSQSRIPAAGESVEANSVRGWAEGVNRDLTRLDKLSGDANVVICTATADMFVGAIVRIAGTTDTIMGGLPGESFVTRAVLALATSPALISGDLGCVIAVCDGGSIGTGKLIRVRRFGLVEFESNVAGGEVVGDYVLVSDLAQPTTLFTATNPRIIGRIVSINGTKFRWVIEQGHVYDRRPTSPFEFEIWTGTSWTKIGGGTTGFAPSFNTTSGAAVGLHAPIKINAGERLHRLTLEIEQDGASLITARLVRGNYTGGIVITAAQPSPASTGAQVWDMSTALGLPLDVSNNQGTWLYISTQSAGNKIVSHLNAYVMGRKPT